jgi:transcriptional regulator with XRE-family HTH domain
MVTMTQTRFAEWLLSKMEANGHETPADLARGAHVPQSSLSAYLNGPTLPGMETAAKLAAHFGVPLDEVIELTRPGADVIPSSEDVVIPEIRRSLARMTPDEQRRFALKAVLLAEELLREAREGDA